MRSEPVMLALLLAACGTGAPDPGFDPPLVTLQANVINPKGLQVKQARVALVWRQATVLVTESWMPGLGVAQEVALEPGFPSAVRLELRHRPPLGALGPSGFGQRAAVGTLLVYVDGNHNQTLDLLPIGALSSDDRILGAPAELSLLYAETSDGAPIPRERAGFHWAKNAAPDLLTGESPDATLELLPLDTEVTIALDERPQLSVHLCRGLDGSNAPLPTCESGCPKVEVPPDGRLHCAADGRSVVIERCPPEGSLCSAACTRHTVKWPVNTPRPDGWPCD